MRIPTIIITLFSLTIGSAGLYAQTITDKSVEAVSACCDSACTCCDSICACCDSACTCCDSACACCDSACTCCDSICACCDSACTCCDSICACCDSTCVCCDSTCCCAKVDSVYCVEIDRGLAIRTNLIWAGAAATPNLGFEIGLSEHWSIGGNIGFKWFPRWLLWDTKHTDKRWKYLVIAPELRWWKEQVYDGFFAGTDLIYSHFNVGGVKFPFGLYPAARQYRFQGDLYGAGLFGGYSWWLDDHWRIEAEAGLGVAGYKAGKFDCPHCGTKLGDPCGVVLIPKVGINISYNLTGRRKVLKEVISEIENLESAR